MYFFQLRQAKHRLAFGNFPDKQLLPYLIIILLAYTTYSLSPDYRPLLVRATNVLASVALVIFGVLYAYRQNGAEIGEQFISRYIVLWWVVGLRIAFFFVAPVALLVVTIEETMLLSIEAQVWLETLVSIISELVIYWRISVHMRDVARMRSDRLSSPTSM